MKTDLFLRGVVKKITFLADMSVRGGGVKALADISAKKVPLSFCFLVEL